MCQWLFESVAGFRPDPDAPGFQRIVFEPVILPALSPVAASHDSIAGGIEAGWSVDGDLVTYQLIVPDGANGTLLLSSRYTDISIDGVPLADPSGDEKARAQLAPGAHTATFRISRA